MGSYSKPEDKRGRIRNLSAALSRHRGRQLACTSNTGSGRGKRNCVPLDAFSNGPAASRVYGAQDGAAADGSISAAAKRSTYADINDDGARTVPRGRSRRESLASTAPCTYCA